MATTPLTAFAGKAKYVSGDVETRDYTPGSAVDAGDVIVIDGWPYVAHQDIPANTLGSLAIRGGIYDVIKDGTSGPTITDGEPIYWIENDELATDDGVGNVHFGKAVEAASDSASRVRVHHDPYGHTT